MHLMQRAVLTTNENGNIRNHKVLDLSYDDELKAFFYVYRGAATCTLREHVLGYRERDARDDT